LFIARHDSLSQSVIGIPAQSMRPTARGGPSGERRGGFRQCSLGSAALFIRKRSARLRPAQSGLCRSDLRGLGEAADHASFWWKGVICSPLPTMPGWSMIRESGYRFSEKIMLKQRDGNM